MTTCFRNAKIIFPDCIREGSVVTEDGIITKVQLGAECTLQGDQVVDCKGMYLSPGFIDIHNHGAGGYDFMDSE